MVGRNDILQILSQNIRDCVATLMDDFNRRGTCAFHQYDGFSHPGDMPLDVVKLQ